MKKNNKKAIKKTSSLKKRQTTKSLDQIRKEIIAEIEKI